MLVISRTIFTVYLLLVSLPATAVSFSADAVQIRDGQLSHAKMTWHGDKVRFDYVQDGVAMAQIFDNKNQKMVWLDTENKQYLKRDLESWQLPQATVRPGKKLVDPCKVFDGAECTRLKQVKLNDRDAVKWLITFTGGPFDQHMFQWIDSKLGIVLRQESHDGSMFDITVQEGTDFEGRQVRKQVMYAVSSDGLSMQGTQWIDEKLNIVVRQENDTGAIDELRNIRTGNIDKGLFQVPGSYKKIKDPVSEAELKTRSYTANTVVNGDAGE